MKNRRREPIITNFGDIHEATFLKLRRKLARQDTDRARSRLEEVAEELDADLTDPEQFRICQELAAA